jgi:hypothetical protein
LGTGKPKDIKGIAKHWLSLPMPGWDLL